MTDLHALQTQLVSRILERATGSASKFALMDAADAVSRAIEAEAREGRKALTREAIMSAQTPAGGWTKETLTAWGVAWPPPSGWIDRLLAPETQEDAAA